MLAAMLALVMAPSAAQQTLPLAPRVEPQPAPPQAEAAPPALPQPSGPPALTKGDVDAWLDGYMPYALRSGDIAGAVVTVVANGQLVTARGYGYADVATRRPVDPDRTLFRPGSVSKLVTWTAAMQLVDEGKLDLDRDINAYLDFQIPPRDGQPVTLRQLMTHTGGFEETVKNLIFFDPNRIVSTRASVADYIPTRIFPPGTTPAYSNYGTHLTAYLVERASGMSFYDYVEQRIFTPLGMRNSTFRQPLPNQYKAQMATGYGQASGEALKFEIVGPAGAGSLSSTGTDMARFMLAHLQGGRGILSPRAAQVMHTTPTTVIPPLNRMMLGFFETNTNGRQIIGHLGDTLGFHTSLHLFMREGVGFYVSFNSGGKEGAVGGLRGAMFQDFADRYFPGGPRDGRVAPAQATEHARMMSGNWQVSRRLGSSWLQILNLIGQVTIATDKDGGLVVSNLTQPGGPPRKWVEIAPFVWRDRDSDDRLAAKVVDGKVVRWSFDTISPFMVYDRVPGGVSSAWLLPALLAGIAILLLTFLYWPITRYIRRRTGRALTVSGPALSAYRTTRLFSGLALAVLIGWSAVFAYVSADTANFSAGLDPVLWILQIAGAVVFFGAVGLAAWNVWLTWRDGRHWTRKIWSVLILLAAIVVLYVAISFGLMSMTVAY
jgi:CubicO group peptidase (beta-lactamase class C family)